MSFESNFLSSLESLDGIAEEKTRLAKLLVLFEQLLSDEETSNDEFMGRALLQRVRAFSDPEHQLEALEQTAGWLSQLAPALWTARIFEELILTARSMSSEEHRIRAGLLMSERFLGLETIAEHLREASFLSHVAFSALSLCLSNAPEYRKRLTCRLRLLRELPENADVVPESWDDLLSASQKLGQWEYRMVNAEGECLWRLSPAAALLGLLSRDFNLSSNREWAESFFRRLLKRLEELAPSPEKEQALHQLMYGLAKSDTVETEDLAEWMGEVLKVAARTQDDPSLIYEGMFLGFLKSNDLHNAFRVALRLPNTTLRDRALAMVIQAYLDLGEPTSAVNALREIQDSQWRGEWILTLSQCDVVVEHPEACAELLEVAVGLPHIVQKAMRHIVEHPNFPEEARQFILEQSPQRPLRFMARRERLDELALLRNHLPELVYRERRRVLLDLLAPEAEKEAHTVGIAVDCLHPYGANLYGKPSEHVERNHFGEGVAGSRVTAWDSFDDMWVEIQPTVLAHLKDTRSVQVIELEFPVDVGTIGLIPFEQTEANGLGVEERNGHPSLFCNSKGKQYPTRKLTIVVGPSEVGANEVPGYAGHSLPIALYTIYPGEAAEPFPRWEAKDLPRLETSTQATLKLLQDGQVEEAKAVLYEALKQLCGTEASARFWSRHILLR